MKQFLLGWLVPIAFGLGTMYGVSHLGGPDWAGFGFGVLVAFVLDKRWA